MQYVKPNNGLFPRPFGRYVKGSLLNKVKSRFRLLGKFLARALMDNRLVDLPLSVPFYKWMLGMEHCLTAADLEHIDPALFRIYCRLQQLVVRKRQLEADLSLVSDKVVFSSNSQANSNVFHAYLNPFVINRPQ